MKLTKLLLALLVGSALVPHARAGVIDLGSAAGTTYLEGLIAPGAFTDSFGFGLSGPSDLSADFKPVFGISGFHWTLDELEGGKYVSLGRHPSFNDLGSGLYKFVFCGTALQPVNIYFGDFHVGAVPETNTWLMLLLAAGLIVYRLPGRQRSLPPSLTV
jgi:hypothetical protein